MFYEIKKGVDVVERFNPLPYPKGHKLEGKSKSGADADADALKRAKDLGADVVVTSDGRKVA